jgi:hypothetical protein
MSQRALALSLRDCLQEWFSWESAVCDTTVDGQPPAAAGELFVSVHNGGFRNPALESRQDRHTILVTITRRVPVAPFDRVSQEIIDQIDIGLEAIADAIAAKVHTDPEQYKVLNRANQYLVEAAGELTVYGFSEPLRFRSISAPQPRSGVWFHSETNEPHAGRSITIVLTDAVRQQSIAGQL